jgi:hypothetical protein
MLLEAPANPDAKIGDPINRKLGFGIHTWSLPARDTCPGRSHLCSDRCYAGRGHFVRPAVAALYRRNLEFSQTDEFTEWMISGLKYHAVRVMRIHVAGDFYDAEYVAKWNDIVARSKRTLFFLYTRSWRDDSMLLPLLQLGRQPNASVWFSIDRETGPAPLHRGIRQAYMAVNDTDAASAPDYCDLVFRDRPAGPLKSVNGVLVCPAENGVAGKLHHTCTSCGVCYDKKRIPYWEQLQRAVFTDDRITDLVAPAQGRRSARTLSKRRRTDSHR